MLHGMCSLDKADEVVESLLVLEPEVHDHAFRADWSAGRSSVSDEMCRALLYIAAIRVMAVVARCIVRLIECMDSNAVGHSASFDSLLIFELSGLIDETFGALLSCLLLSLCLG